jgi:hypothetical protein
MKNEGALAVRTDPFPLAARRLDCSTARQGGRESMKGMCSQSRTSVAPPSPPTCLPTCLPACLPTCLPAYLHTYLPTYLPASRLPSSATHSVQILQITSQHDDVVPRLQPPSPLPREEHYIPSLLLRTPLYIFVYIFEYIFVYIFGRLGRSVTN